MTYRDRTFYSGKGKTEYLYSIIKRLYEGELLSETEAEHGPDANLQVFLHTHQIEIPVPITKFVTKCRWTDSSTPNGGTGSITMRMPFAILNTLLMGEGLEPSTGHFITFRRRTASENRAVDADEIKRRPRPNFDGQTAEQWLSQNVASFPLVTAQDLANAARAESANQREFAEAFENEENRRINRLKNKRDKIFFETFWCGIISNIQFGLVPSEDGLETHTDVTLTLQSWEYILKTTNYKIVNANIDRTKRSIDEDGDGIPDTFSSKLGGTGARFIITNEIFKEIVRQVKNSVTTEQDPKIGIKQILSTFAYHRLPLSLKKGNLGTRKLFEELEKLKAERKNNTQKRIRSQVGTSQEIDGDQVSIDRIILQHGITEFKDKDGRVYSRTEINNMDPKVFYRKFVTELQGDSITVQVRGTRAVSLADNIKVCTVKEDIPPSCGFLRHLLPTKVEYFKNISRIQELLTQNGTPWTRILGSFVSDTNIIDFYPLIFPVTKEDIKAGYDPEGMLSIIAGYQLALIWRVRPLRPDEIINKEYYNDYSEFANQNLRAWREFNRTEIEFANDKLWTEDSESSPASMGLSNLSLHTVDFNYNEAGRVNGCYLEHPFLRSESNLKFGTLSQPMIDTWASQHYGFKMYEGQYPYLDATKNKLERDALTERIYCVMRDQGEGANGQAVFRGLHGNPLRPGIFVSFAFDKGSNPAHGMDSIVKQAHGTYYDNQLNASLAPLNFTLLFTCMVDAITYDFFVNPQTGLVEKTTILNFSRGKFHGGPTIMPEAHDFGRPTNNIVALPPEIREADGSLFIPEDS